MSEVTEPLIPSEIYHVYSHANGHENLFRCDENYSYFLKKYEKHVHPVAETFAYCLLPNHLHFMVRIRNEEHLLDFFSKKLIGQNLKSYESLSGLISKQFSNLFNAYAKAYNKMFDRRGSLFERPFKRKPVGSEAYLTTLMVYIHRNPLHHGFVRDINDWEYSSWHSYLLDGSSIIARKAGLEWFGGIEEFIKVHSLDKQDLTVSSTC